MGSRAVLMNSNGVEASAEPDLPPVEATFSPPVTPPPPEPGVLTEEQILEIQEKGLTDAINNNQTIVQQQIEALQIRAHAQLQATEEEKKRLSKALSKARSDAEAQLVTIRGKKKMRVFYKELAALIERHNLAPEQLSYVLDMAKHSLFTDQYKNG